MVVIVYSPNFVICELLLILFFYTNLSNAKALVKINCLKSTKDLIILHSNLIIVIVNWLCTQKYSLFLLLMQLHIFCIEYYAAYNKLF